MKIDRIGNLCLWCMEEMGESPCCPHCGHDEREQGLPAGCTIGEEHYLIGRTLRQDGLGITYLAYDLKLHAKCVIKEYFPRELVTRVGNTVKVAQQSEMGVYQKGVISFYRESQSIARFSGHPNVVQVQDVFRDNDTAYFVMDYVEGISFRQYLAERDGHISCEEALRILKPIGEALTALHGAGFLYQNVKPDNIFITRDGTPKLLDFGTEHYKTPETTHNSAAVNFPFTDIAGLLSVFSMAVSSEALIPAQDRMMGSPLLDTETAQPTATNIPTAITQVKAPSVITDEIRDAQVGDNVYYGHYVQDNDSNEAKPIEWRVLAREGNQLLLISEYGLDVQPFNKEDVPITWEECTSRFWLNRGFYKDAFNPEERKQIAITNVKAEKNPDLYQNPENDTQDRIFLLSIQEAKMYFSCDSDRRCNLTAYAAAKRDSKFDSCTWWLRNHNHCRSHVRAAYVDFRGYVDKFGDSVNNNCRIVRPALWLNL